jgi:hypothetical protein
MPKPGDLAVTGLRGVAFCEPPISELSNQAIEEAAKKGRASSSRPNG